MGSTSPLTKGKEEERETMTDTILVPIIEDKTGNASSKANYRPIALTSVLSKVF